MDPPTGQVQEMTKELWLGRQLSSMWGRIAIVKYVQKLRHHKDNPFHLAYLYQHTFSYFFELLHGLPLISQAPFYSNAIITSNLINDFFFCEKKCIKCVNAICMNCNM